MSDIVPPNAKRLRACLLCSLVKSYNQFINEGCDNCDQLLNMKKDQDRVAECTSANFEGVVAVMKPQDSWVCKWQRVDKFVQGIYAVQVLGKLSIDIQEQLLDKGIKYRPRDGTAND